MTPLNGRHASLSEVSLKMLVLVSGALWLIQCSYIPGEEDERSVPDVPPADRESWDCLIELGGSGMHVSIRAPYLQDFADLQETRADSGADLELADSTGAVMTRLAGSRLVVNHRQNRLTAGGAISLASTDSLELQSDSLVWDRASNRMEVPGAVSVRTSGLSLKGQNLLAGEEFDYWIVERVSGTLSGRSAQGEPYEVRIEALRDSTVRGTDGLVAHYDSVLAEVDDFRIRSAAASWSQSTSVVSFTGRVHAAESGTVSRRIDADELLYDIGADRRVARGEVTLQEDDEIRLVASRLEEDGDGGWRASGDLSLEEGGEVILEVGDRSFRAIELRYENSQSVYTAFGAAFRRDDHTMLADSLIYRREVDLLEARGGVSLSLPEMGGSASAQAASFDLAAERARLEGTASEPARLSRQRTEEDSSHTEEDSSYTEEDSSYGEEDSLNPREDTLYIEAVHMDLDLAAERLTGNGGFWVRAGGGNLEVAGESGSFQSERLELGGGVRFRQLDSEDLAAQSRLETDSMTVQLENGRLGRIDLPGHLRGLIKGGSGQTSWLSAEAGSAYLEEERLKRVELSGSAVVTHRSPSSASVNRFRADVMSLFFDPRGGLLRVQARGSAELTSRLPPPAEATPADTVPTPSVPFPRLETQLPVAAPDSAATTGASDKDSVGGSTNRVSGQGLNIRLEEGRVVEVEVTESIEGRYLPGEEGGKGKRD